MQTKLEKRDLEFENLLGNLLIAEYQVEKLRERVSQNLGTDFSNMGKISEVRQNLGEYGFNHINSLMN